MKSRPASTSPQPRGAPVLTIVTGSTNPGIKGMAEALAICAQIGAANLGLAVDVYHVWWDATLSHAFAGAQGRILGYHLCDWLETTGDWLLSRGMMGDGVADLRALRAAVEGGGLSGPVRD